MKQTRQQLTLFLEEAESTRIEEMRQRFNPLQFALIGSHITLCREDEIGQIDIVRRNLRHLKQDIFALHTAPAERTADGKGVFIPVIDADETFQGLRKLVLQGTGKAVRYHAAHITIMHPRNSSCEGYMFEEIKATLLPQKLHITKISLIEQEIGKQWHTIHTYSLKNGR